MAFERPITIEEALKHISRNEYLLPAIQREVVWQKSQIQRLFDSLMQGYPIGSFLFWKVEEEHSKDFIFYEFMTNYHQKNNRHLKKHDMLQKRALTAVLDGQQRLTALNIGLRGSHAEKLPYKWAEFDSNYPKKYLYIRLDQLAPPNEDGLLHDFRFLTPEQAAGGGPEEAHWFRVGDVFDMDPDLGIYDYVSDNNLGASGNKTPHRTLTRLHRLVHADAIINYYLEPSQDLDKVLNIFIRINSGGTPLSKSDLLLSIATSQWKQLDAREAIYGLVDELNGVGSGFAFSKDLVLKTGLMLADIPSVAFRVTNFNSSNMARLEASWEEISHALRLTTRLLADFGLSDRTLSADSVVIPVAYYLHKINASEAFLTHSGRSADRQRIRNWVIRSLIKSGIWGSGLDQLLLSLRTVLRSDESGEFPVDDLEEAMLQRGKSLRFTEEEVRNLATMSFTDKRLFSFLSMLYPGMDFKNSFNVDHVFPANTFSKAKLLKAGVPEDQIDIFMDSYNRLPNLQLLEGPINQSKQDKHPNVWADQYFTNPGARADYFDRHMLGNVPDDIIEFMYFYNARLERIVQRAKVIVGFSPGSSVNEDVYPTEI